MPGRGVYLLLFIFFLAAVAAVLRSFTSVPYEQNGKINVAGAVAHWEKLIDAYGPQRAHDEMVKEVSAKNPNVFHPLAHTFGEALYEEGKLSYVGYCGVEFDYGCYHQVLGHALTEYGHSAVGQVEQQCETTQTKARSCIHGVGHALVSHYGYTEEALLAALDDCRIFAKGHNALNGCAGGAFMEYNLREILSGAIQDMRPLSTTTATEPCTRVPKEVRGECAYELPLWWGNVRSGTTPGNLFEWMGARCRSYASADLVDGCFAGIGVPAAWIANFNPTLIAYECTSASKTDRERLFCVGQAAQSYPLNDTPLGDACAKMSRSKAEEALCEEAARSDLHVNNMASYAAIK